jgi:hypothetical protein
MVNGDGSDAHLILQQAVVPVCPFPEKIADLEIRQNGKMAQSAYVI